MVRFQRRDLKNEIYKRRFRLSDRSVSITEHLTESNLILLKESEKAVASRKDVWSQEGKVFAKVKGKKRVIRNLEDLKVKLPPADLTSSKPPTSNHGPSVSSKLPTSSQVPTTSTNLPTSSQVPKTLATFPNDVPLGSKVKLPPKNNSAEETPEISSRVVSAYQAALLDISNSDSCQLGRENPNNPAHINFTVAGKGSLGVNINTWHSGPSNHIICHQLFHPLVLLRK